MVTGSVTALDQTITATDASGGSAETLNGLIEVNAPIVAGDSGGPLTDSCGKVIGIDTAASASQAAAVRRTGLRLRWLQRPVRLDRRPPRATPSRSRRR